MMKQLSERYQGTIDTKSLKLKIYNTKYRYNQKRHYRLKVYLRQRSTDYAFPKISRSPRPPQVLIRTGSK